MGRACLVSASHSLAPVSLSGRRPGLLLPNAVQYLLPGNHQEHLRGKVRRESHRLGLGGAGGEGREQEKKTGCVKSRVGVTNLPAHGCSRSSPRRPREGAQGQVRQGGRAARSGAGKQALEGLAEEEGEAQTMGTVHRCRATLGSLGRAPGSGHVTAPELITNTARAGLRLFPPALKLFILQVTPAVCSGSHL